MAAKSHSLLSVTIAALALAILSSCSLLPARRSTEAFCKTLDDGVATMKQNYESAQSEGTLGLLHATADNVGELTRIIRRLDKVAPDEIADDMHAVRETWDKQADLPKEAANNPLGAIASSVASGVMTLGSLKAVDKFAAAHCQNQLA